MRRVLLSLLVLAMLPIVSIAQTERRVRKSVSVHFRQGQYKIDENYRNNGALLREFFDSLAILQQDEKCHLDDLRIVVSTSPEGNVAVNEQISKLRADAIAGWIRQNISAPIEYSLEVLNPDWETLIDLAETSSDLPHRDEVLEILRGTSSEPSSKNTDSINRAIARLRYGVPYVWMLENLYPELRYSKVYLDAWWDIDPVLTITTEPELSFAAVGGNGSIGYSKNVVDEIRPTVSCDAEWIKQIEVSDSGITFRVEPNEAEAPRESKIIVNCYGVNHEIVVKQAAAPVRVEEPKVVEVPQVVEPVPAPEPAGKPIFMAVKTNMLYLLGIVPNVGVEFALGKQWSIAANWQYSWWKSDRKEWYWRTYGGDIALRRWFGKANLENPLSGHHAGVYGQMISYDFLLNNKGYLADRWSWAVGLEYGYSLPIARRLNIDFTLGVGYHWGEFKEYTPIDNHYVWEATKQRHYVGPTKLEVSLVWLLGRDNYHKNKGVRR